MKLSEAILLGDTLKKCDPHLWLSTDGSCGCAFGGALLAAGVTAHEFHTTYNNCPTALNEQPFVRERWPWLTLGHLAAITNLYCRVADGQKTIEDVADYVRSVEPPDLPETATTETITPETVTA